MELVSVVGAVGLAEGLVAYVKYDPASFGSDHPFRTNARAVALARDRSDFGDLTAREGWHPIVNQGVAAWTDDYSNVLGAIIRKKFGS
jgi:hypothetical protein